MKELLDEIETAYGAYVYLANASFQCRRLRFLNLQLYSSTRLKRMRTSEEILRRLFGNGSCVHDGVSRVEL